jgi:hypothetical protein
MLCEGVGLSEAAAVLPEPLISLARSTEEQLHDSEELVRVSIDVAFEFLVETLTAWCLAEAAQSGAVRLDARQLAPLNKPTVGQSLALCDRLMRALPPESERGLLGGLFAPSSEKTIWLELHSLLAERNRRAHGSSGRRDPGADLAAIERCFLHLGFLRGVRAEIGDAKSAVSNARMLGRTTEEVALSSVVLTDGERILVLDPWMVALEDGTVFVLRRIDRESISYYDALGHKLHGDHAFPGSAPSSPVIVETPDESVGRASTSLERTVRLIRRYLDPHGLDHLSRRFDAMGFVGSGEARLIEYCLERDLRDLFTELFSEPTLHRIARDLGLEPDPLEARATVTKRILESLQIPVPPKPIGISDFAEHLRTVSARLDTASDRAVLRGLIGEAGTALERLLADLVQFYATVIFNADPEEAFRDRGWLQPHHRLARASMGMLFELLARIDASVRDLGSSTAARYAELFPEKAPLLALSEREKSSIAQVRNAFSHPSERLDAMDLRELRKLGRDMLSAVQTFVDHLVEAEIYPRVVAVKETVSDAFGRRFVRAVDASGREEKIYTDREMEPGALYFMHPLTNPVRIFPILVKRSQFTLVATS